MQKMKGPFEPIVLSFDLRLKVDHLLLLQPNRRKTDEKSLVAFHSIDGRSAEKGKRN